MQAVAYGQYGAGKFLWKFKREAQSKAAAHYPVTVAQGGVDEHDEELNEDEEEYGDEEDPDWQPSGEEVSDAEEVEGTSGSSRKHRGIANGNRRRRGSRRPPS